MKEGDVERERERGGGWVNWLLVNFITVNFIFWTWQEMGDGELGTYAGERFSPGLKSPDTLNTSATWQWENKFFFSLLQESSKIPREFLGRSSYLDLESYLFRNTSYLFWKLILFSACGAIKISRKPWNHRFSPGSILQSVNSASLRE